MKEKMNFVINAFDIVLAVTHVLYLKTQNYHCNAERSHFETLHEMIKSQYDNLFETIDVVEEIISGLGSKIIGSSANFQVN
jgi:DNA-binding ferritin-like protein